MRIRLCVSALIPRPDLHHEWRAASRPELWHTFKLQWQLDLGFQSGERHLIQSRIWRAGKLHEG